MSPTTLLQDLQPQSMSSSLIKFNSNYHNTYQGQISLGTIPQLDGLSNVSAIYLQQQQEKAPVPIDDKECDNWHKVFETKQKLEHHNDEYQFGCEDCFICFTSTFHADLHELDKHPDTCYASDHIPPFTKLQFAAEVRWF